MSNIYICFSNREEKVDFMLDFLNLRAVLNGSDNVKRSKKAKLVNENGIHELIRNVDDGLYRKLQLLLNFLNIITGSLIRFKK